MVAALKSAPCAVEPHKKRGAFFTPEPIARHIAEWAVRDPSDRVLEPSCGEGTFLLAAAERYDRLGVSLTDPAAAGLLDGVELHDASAATARQRLRDAGAHAHVVVRDFLDMEPTGSYDAVIGNPPYVRYHDFTGHARDRSRAAALEAGVRLTNLASSWAGFTVHATRFLKSGGRLGFVLPAELLNVNYADEVRAFLLGTFERIDLVVFTERVFPGVLEEVVLLLADGYGHGLAPHIGVVETRNAGTLAQTRTPRRTWAPSGVRDRWSPSLLPTPALETYTRLTTGPGAFTTLDTWADTTLGMVTGNNGFFTMPQNRVDSLGLAPSDLVRICPSGSRHLRGLAFTADGWQALADESRPVWLFRPDDQPSPAGRSYIAQGEADGVADAYKCRAREPWWRVPLVPTADLFLTYMNADTPRLTTNRVGVPHLNSVHGVHLHEEHHGLGRDLLALASLNTLTLLGAETVGRSYGGGILKLEPREADRLPVPSPSLVAGNAAALAERRGAVSQALDEGRLLEAVRVVDDVLLRHGLGIGDADHDALVEAHAHLSGRRATRGQSAAATARTARR